MLLKDKIVVAIVTIFIIVGIYFLGVNFGKNKQKNDKTYLPNTYITCNVINNNQNNQELKSVKYIYSFDQNDICIDFRSVWEFSSEEIANKNYTSWKETGLSNLTKNSTIVSFNDSTRTGKSKSEILEDIKKQQTSNTQDTVTYEIY